MNNPTEARSKDEITNRNVAVYFAMASLTPTIALHAAMVRDLLSRGNKVTVYACDGSFRSPTDNPFNRRSIQRFQMFRVRDAVRGLPVRLKIINLDGWSEEVPDRASEALATGTMSSFASLVKAQSREDLNPTWLGAYENMLSSAKKLYNYFANEVRTEGFEFVCTFNTRFGDGRPVLEVARDTNIGFVLYDLKRAINEVVYVNELIHSISGGTRRALAAYEANRETAAATAEKYFEKKILRESTGDPVFTKMQERGSLPDAVKDTAKQVIAIYPTTEDEYKFIGKEWDGRIPESQVDEIEGLAKALPAERYILVVKMHPNQGRILKNIMEKYMALEKNYPHVIVERPFSKKDTYALMRRADVVVTFASTAGVEACYAGKPVILIGDTDWGSLNIAHKVYTGETAAKLIEQGVEPKPKLGAIIWGNYLYAQKDRMPSLQVLEGGNYSVDGRKIGHSAMRRLLQMPARFEIYVKTPGVTLRSLFSRVLGTAANILKGM